MVCGGPMHAYVFGAYRRVYGCALRRALGSAVGMLLAREAGAASPVPPGR